MPNSISSKSFESIFARVSRLQHMAAISSWDEAVCMPIGGIHARANAVSELSLVIDELLKSKELSLALSHANENPTERSLWDKANLRESMRVWTLANVLDPKLVEKKAQVNMKSEQAWRSFRANNDFQSYLPIFREVLDLAKEEARQRSASTGLKPYDAMMDLYQPGLSSARVSIWFEDLKVFLKQLLPNVLEKQKQIQYTELTGVFPIEKQKQLGIEVMTSMGFDFDHGRLDVSTHPFCGGVPQDVRITTRYDESNFFQSMMGVIHETGHALYEQHLPSQWSEQMVGQSRGMAVHESQSLFMEMQLARSQSCYSFLEKLICKYFPEHNPVQFRAENLFRLSTRIRKGFIRVDADEVTYPLHVILRFEIEKELIEGNLKIEELPKVWNEKMMEYLDLSTLGNDKMGCMQDVHWPSGSFGYFPSYTVGAMLAAQLRRHLDQTIPDFSMGIAQGNFKPAREYLNKSIWSQASLLSMDDLIVQATGKPLRSDDLKQHLTERYLS